MPRVCVVPRRPWWAGRSAGYLRFFAVTITIGLDRHNSDGMILGEVAGVPGVAGVEVLLVQVSGEVDGVAEGVLGTLEGEVAGGGLVVVEDSLLDVLHPEGEESLLQRGMMSM